MLPIYMYSCNAVKNKTEVDYEELKSNKTGMDNGYVLVQHEYE